MSKSSRKRRLPDVNPQSIPGILLPVNRVWVTTKVNTRRTKQFKVFREVNPVQSMSAKVIPIDIKLQRAWADYVSCRERAEASKNINDGIAAGNAWRRWLEMFTPKEPRPQ